LRQEADPAYGRGMRPALLLPIVLAFASCSGSGAEDDPPRVTVQDAVVTLPAVPGRPGAAYFTLESNAPAALVSVASPRAARIELHEAGMRPAARFALRPGEALRFEPGGRHAMLFGLDPALRPGDRLALTFTFDGAPSVSAQAEVRGPGDVHAGH
jgi:copper(I)-binding protein